MVSKLVVIFILAATVLMGIFVVQHIYFDASFQAFLDEESPSIQNFQKVSEQFGDAGTLMILSSFSNTPSRDLADLARAVDQLKALEYVNGVHSIFDAQTLDRLTPLPPFIQTRPYVTVEEGTYTLDQAILDDPLYAGLLVSPDGKQLVTILQKKSEATIQPRELVVQVEAILSQTTSMPTQLVGEDVVDYELFESIRSLTFVYPPLILAVVLFVFFLKFRSFVLSFLTLIPPVLSSVWIYFFLLLMGRNINSLTVMSPTFIIIIGSAYGMHFLSRYQDLNHRQLSNNQRIFSAGKEERIPVLFSALTTMAGFSSYIFLPMPAFRDMGIFASTGILLSAVFTLVVLPFFLRFAHPKVVHKRPVRPLVFPKWLRWGFTGFVFLGLAACIYFIPRVPNRIDSYDYFRKSSPLRQAVEQIRQGFGWISTFYLLVEPADGTDLVLSPDQAQKLQQVFTQIAELEHVVKTSSIFDIARGFSVSPSLLVSASRLNETARQMASTYLQPGATRGMVLVDSNDNLTASEIQENIHSILETYPELSQEFSFSLVGSPLVWSDLSGLVVENQVQSFLSSFALIFLLLLLTFRNPKTALISTIPIVITVTFNFLFMAILRIPLDIPTSIISGLLMGLVIDYAIHYMYWFRKHGDAQEAARTTGNSIAFNGMSLMASFAVLLTAPLVLYANLAVLVIIGIGVGVLSTLVFLPFLVRVLHEKAAPSRKKHSP